MRKNNSKVEAPLAIRAEEALKKAKNKGEAQARLNHAQFVLQTIRGGTPHDKLANQFGIKFTTAPVEPAK